LRAAGLIYDWQYRARQWAVGQLCRLRRGAAAAAHVLPSEPSRVLVVMTGLIGDTVMSTPLVIEARRLWPAAEITLLGRRHNCELLAACPLLDARYEAPAIPFSLRRRRELARLDDWLRAQKFDVALIALGDQFAAALAAARIPVRVGVRGHALEPCLTHTYSIGSAREWGPRERLNALRSLGYEVSDAAPRLWVADDARGGVRARLAGLGLAPGTPYAVAHPFGSTPRQWWPVERVKELAADLRDTHGLTTVLVGGPETRGALNATRGAVDDRRVDFDEARGAAEEAAVSTAESLIDATGVFDIPQLLAVVEGAAVVVTTDSGPFHIAGALGRPLVGLFRARRPEHAGHYARARVLLGRDERCATDCAWDRCRAEPCRQMDALGAGEAAGAVREILGA
jgi:ADP-heptose:LPS heptosyltransferase